MVLLLDGGRGAGGAARRQHGLPRRGQARGRFGEALARQRRHGVTVLEGVDLLRRRLVLGSGPGGALVVPHPGRRERDDRDDADDDDGRDRQLAAREGELAVTEEAELGAADERDGDDPGEGDRNEELPAEAHELVVAHARQGATQPDEDEHEHPQLGGEPQQAPPAAAEHVVVDRRDERRGLPATEEQGGGQGRDGEHVDVLAEEEHGEAHRGVLGVEATGQLALALGEVEGQAVGLADHGDDVDGEAEERREDVPERALRRDDGRGRHRPAVEEDRDEREAHGDLVADDLGGRAQATEQRVGRARAPAGEDDAVDADRCDGEHEQDGDGDVGDLQRRQVAEHRHRAAERDDREGDECHRRGDERREGVDELLGAGRRDVFLEHRLHAVGQGLEQTEGTVAVRARALLHAADDAALEPDDEQRRDEQVDEDADGLDQGHPPRGVAEVGRGVLGHGQRGCHPVCGQAEAHAAPPFVTWTRPPASVPRPERIEQSWWVESLVERELVGSQTTPSTIPSVTTAGSVTLPAGPETVTWSPSTSPSPAAEASDRRATASGAVPARNGSPSCMRPASRSVAQLDRTKSPLPSGAVATRWPSGALVARAPPHGPSASNWAWISRWVRVSRKTPISLASMSRARWSLTALVSRASSKARTRPSQLT